MKKICHNPFYRTSLSLAILSVSSLVSQSVFADEKPNTPKATIELNENLQRNQQIFDSENYVYQVDNPIQNLPNSPNSNDSLSNDVTKTDNNTKQNFTNKINQRIENQTLTDFDNFDQPMSTFENKHLLNNSDIQAGDLPSLATKNTAPMPQEIVNSTKSLNRSEQLSDNAIQPDADAQAKNLTNQTDDVDANDIINPDDYLPEYQQKTAHWQWQKPIAKWSLISQIC